MRARSDESESLEIDTGDGELWRACLARTIPLLYAMCVRRGIHPALAEEITQATVFDAVRNRSGYDPARGALDAWIVGIGRNRLALEMRRRAARQRHEAPLADWTAALDAAPLPDEVLEREETRGRIRQALDRLDPREKQVLELKYLEDLPARRIGALMNLTEKAVHSLLYRARNALRARLAKSDL